MAMAAITAVPSHDVSRTARVDPALVRYGALGSRIRIQLETDHT
jgi:hypothetical protein